MTKQFVKQCWLSEFLARCCNDPFPDCPACSSIDTFIKWNGNLRTKIFHLRPSSEDYFCLSPFAEGPLLITSSEVLILPSQRARRPVR